MVPVGALGGFLSDPDVQDALEACGIDLPRAPTDDDGTTGSSLSP